MTSEVQCALAPSYEQQHQRTGSTLCGSECGGEGELECILHIEHMYVHVPQQQRPHMNSLKRYKSIHSDYDLIVLDIQTNSLAHTYLDMYTKLISA